MRVNMEQKDSLEKKVQELLLSITSKTDHYESLISTQEHEFLKLLQDLLSMLKLDIFLFHMSFIL